MDRVHSATRLMRVMSILNKCGIPYEIGYKDDPDYRYEIGNNDHSGEIYDVLYVVDTYDRFKVISSLFPFVDYKRSGEYLLVY